MNLSLLKKIDDFVIGGSTNGPSAIAFVVWYIIADLQTAIRFTVTTLVIACPHALGLAIPLVVARSTSLGASRGLLFKKTVTHWIQRM